MKLRSNLRKFVQSREAILLVLLFLVMVFAQRTEPKFVTWRAQVLLADNLWELAIVSIPMLLIVMAGGIDLSVGSSLALSAVIMGLLFAKGVPILIACAIALVAGLALGFANGWFIAKLKVHPLIVTLATLAMFRGIAEGISSGRSISNFPDWFLNWAEGKWMGIPIPAIVFALLAFGTWFLLAKMRLGRWIKALGLDEEVTRFSAIPTEKIKLGLYSVSGLLCAVAAILLVSRNNTAKADLASGLELQALTAVVLGGASIEGGTGSIFGLICALFLIHETREYVSWHWQQNELDQVIVGGLLIVSLLFDQARKFFHQAKIANPSTPSHQSRLKFTNTETKK